MLTNKEVEQRTIDLWLDGKVTIYSLIMAMIEFQSKRKLLKSQLYSHDGAYRCERCNLIYAKIGDHDCIV